MTIGVALIGAGGIGTLRAAAVNQTPGLRLTVVSDVRSAAAESVAQQYVCAASDDWVTAVRRPDVGLVIVSTPPNLHGAMALGAIAAGKHVLVEKPLAHTLHAAEQICAAAEAQGVFVNTGFNHRHYASMAFARRLLDSGTLGEVISVRAYAGHPGGEEFGHDWIHDPRVTGGGSLVDNGIHILDLARFFGGDMTSAMGYVANLVWPFEGAEDNGFALFRSATGSIAYVHASWTEWRGYQFAVEIVGTRGYVRAAYPPMLVEWGTTPAPGIRARRHFNLFPWFQLQERARGWQWTVIQSFVQELRALAVGISSNTAVAPTGRDGLRAMQMAHAIYRSSREGVEVAL